MKTIRRQLTVKLLLGFALLLGCGGAGIYLCTRAALLDEFDETLRARANAISSSVEVHGKRIGLEISEQFLPEYDEGVAVNFFQLRLTNGTTIRRSLSLTNADLPVVASKMTHPKFWDLQLPSGFQGRATSYTFVPRNSREGESAMPTELSIVVASDRRELDEMLTALALVLLGCGGLLLVVTAFTVPRVLKSGLAPLDQLAEQTTRINADSLSNRFPVDVLPGELKPIGERLNDLLSRLQQSFERERQFSADLAHELRTPIAELRSLADVALKWPESRAAQMDRDTLAVAIQMEGIVTRLLELVRSERGQLTVSRESISLGPFVENIWQTFVTRADEKQINVVRNISQDIKIESDAVLLRSILINLFDNAVEYISNGGMIQINAFANGKQFTVEVVNTAENLETQDVPKLFDRFWRKDFARTGSKHSGLGLSLARTFAQAIGCNLVARLDDGSRLTVKISGEI